MLKPVVQYVEVQPFAAAQLMVWLERGAFDGHEIWCRKRGEELLHPLGDWIPEILTMGHYQLQSTAYSSLMRTGAH